IKDRVTSWLKNSLNTPRRMCASFTRARWTLILDISDAEGLCADRIQFNICEASATMTAKSLCTCIPLTSNSKMKNEYCSFVANDITAYAKSDLADPLPLLPGILYWNSHMGSKLLTLSVNASDKIFAQNWDLKWFSEGRPPRQTGEVINSNTEVNADRAVDTSIS
ncbi:17339_t:CDS:1, partial [Racocetra persica]